MTSVIPSARGVGACPGIQHQTHCLRIVQMEALGVSSDLLSAFNFGRPWALLLAFKMPALLVASEFFQPVFPIALNYPKVTTTSAGRK